MLVLMLTLVDEDDDGDDGNDRIDEKKKIN